MIGVAAAIAARSMRLKVGIAASVAANVLARPELVTIYSKEEKVIYIIMFHTFRLETKSRRKEGGGKVN